MVLLAVAVKERSTFWSNGQIATSPMMIYIHIYVSIYTCVYIYIYILIHIYICTYIYKLVNTCRHVVLLVVAVKERSTPFLIAEAIPAVFPDTIAACSSAPCREYLVNYGG